MKQFFRAALCVILLAALSAGLMRLMARPDAEIPGLTAKERVLLHIWVMDAPGGAQAWLTAQLRAWEKAHPQVTTYVRQVSASALAEEEAVLPDIVLYMQGNVTAPERLFVPLTGDAVHAGVMKPALLRCGRWRDAQYALPLCWAGWVLAIDSTLEPGTAATPAPTTLLGRPAATAIADATPTPGYPLPAASKADCALQSPGGAALFTLGMLLDGEDRPPLPESFAQEATAEVYSGFLRQRWATAMLTTGQMTALSSLASAGSAFPFRVMAPDAVITDQVWAASLTREAPAEAALLLAHLTSAGAQQALAAQGLYPVREDVVLYASGPAAEVEAAARRTLAAINLYVDAAAVRDAAWRCWQGTSTLDEALLPLV